jgi:hypothetical protein
MTVQLKPSLIDPKYYGCPRCGWPMNIDEDPGKSEFEDTGGMTCPCGGFVSLPDPPKTKENEE